MGYYDDLVETHGDNDACKRKYKVRQIVKVMIKVGGFPSILIIAYMLKYWSTGFVVGAGGWLLLLWTGVAVTCLIINRKALDTIHTKPDLDSMDLCGGEICYDEENGRNVFTVQYRAWPWFIVGEYYGNQYHLSIQQKSTSFRQHAKMMQEYPPVTEEKLPEVLAQVAESVAEISQEANQQS